MAAVTDTYGAQQLPAGPWSGNPMLTRLGDYFRAVVEDRCLDAWKGYAGSKQSLFRAIEQRNVDDDNALTLQELPTLLLWTAGIPNQGDEGDGLPMAAIRVGALHIMAPPQKEHFFGQKEFFLSVVAPAYLSAIERERDPSYVDADDAATDSANYESAKHYGTNILRKAGIESWRLVQGEGVQPVTAAIEIGADRPPMKSFGLMLNLEARIYPSIGPYTTAPTQFDVDLTHTESGTPDPLITAQIIIDTP